MQLKALRIKDSLKMESLVQEIKNLASLNQKRQKEEALIQIQKKDSLEYEGRKKEIERYKAKTEGIPVKLFTDTLYFIYTDIGPFEAKDRANHDEKKILELYDMVNYLSDSLVVKKYDTTINVLYQNQIVTSITELDALWNGKTIEDIALEYRDTIDTSIKKYQADNSLKSKIFRVGELFLIIIGMILLFYVINSFLRLIKKKLVYNNEFLKHGIRFNNYSVLKRKQLTTLFLRALDVLRLFLYIISIFSILPFAFKIFPNTAYWAEAMQSWISEPLQTVKNSFISYIPNVFKIAIVVLIGRFMIRIMRYFSIEIERENLVISNFHVEWAKPTFTLIRFILNIFILIIIFPLLPGADSVAFKGISVFLGVLLSIGSSSAISNAVSGMVITYMRPFQIGDWIKTKDMIGKVMEKNILVTRLRTINNEDVTVPNSTILSDHTINYSSMGKEVGIGMSIRIKIKYEYPSNIVEEHLIQAALNTSKITPTIPPYVLQLELGEINATYELNAYTLCPDDMFYIKSDLVKNIKKELEEAKIELASTQYVEIKNDPYIK